MIYNQLQWQLQWFTTYYNPLTMAITMVYNLLQFNYNSITINYNMIDKQLQ